MGGCVDAEAVIDGHGVGAVPRPGRAARWFAAALLGAIALAGCTIRAGDSVDANGGASSLDESPAATDTCDEADRLPASDKLAAAETGEAALTDQGMSLADAWADPAAFQLFQEAAYASVGCDLRTHLRSDAGKVQQELHVDAGPDYYCGPEHGSGSLVLPAVSGCLNDLCRAHDACYAQCSRPTGLVCMWGGPTAACDDPFIQDLAGCEDDSNEFGSFLVRFLATGLYAAGITGAGCPADMTCPGNGPCLTDRSSEACTYCPEKRDIGGVCLQRACTDDPDETTCYAANCPTVSGCYGGYDVPVPPATVTPVQDIDPKSRWSLSVLQAVIPDTKPTGETWDADAGGVANPDVVISVRVGQSEVARGETVAAPDNLAPTWLDALPLIEATALDLQTAIEFSATDIDLAFNDPIGTCSTTAVASDFAGEPVAFECADDRRDGQ